VNGREGGVRRGEWRGGVKEASDAERAVSDRVSVRQ
jgi:hypothetical protein